MTPPPDGPLRLLVVDDDRVDRAAVIRALRRIDLEVEATEADSVAGAREALAGASFDAVVVDYHLPDGEGLDVLRATRRLPEAVPVIVLTGHGDEDLAVELMKEGARDYIPKAHLSPARLGQSLRHVVEVVRAERETRRARSAQQFLVDASAELARSIDYEATVERIPGLVVPAMADYALLHLTEDDDRLRLAASAHRDPDEADHLAGEGGGVLRSGTGSPLLEAVESGEPVLAEEIDEAWMAAATRDAAHLALVRRLGPRSVVVVPLRARGRILGTLAVAFSSSGRRYDEQDLAVIQNLAIRAALALDNARLYRGAQEATRIRDETLAIVSHDLRNPLNVIATSAALMLEIPLPEEKKRAQLEVIKRTTERMNRLIQDLLDVTTIEAGRLKIEPLEVTARALVEEACESMAPLVEEKGITLVRECRQPEATVSVDRERILQVFGNLIGNAIRYTPAEGRITVGSETTDLAVRFYVEDTGSGISPTQQEHLFDRFWRGEHQGATGTGLGLPIARGIVEMHGGTIEVHSEPDRGSRFVFTLPPGHPSGGKAA